jgi:DNA-binding NtrC family response regulator
VVLHVVQLSESFAELWQRLGGMLDAPVTVVEAGEHAGVPHDAAAVVLAAGGAENEAMEWLEREGVRPAVPVYVVGADPERRTAVRTVTAGAADYFALPEDLELLKNALAAAVTRRKNDLARGQGEEPAEAFATLVGTSPALRGMLARAARILPHATTTVLILGETGTGKELLGRAIHEGGPRRNAPFVPVNCSALPSHLIESELFGHERGSFTDAHAAKPGLFEVADGGTLFLDEIGTIPVEVQAKLLRVLEDRQVRRVGGTKFRKVDVRIIAATNENPRAAVAAGRFREDLFFRLSVVTFALPPLRERGEDTLVIADELLRRFAKQYGLPAARLTPEARSALLAYSWPGNVRELKNAIERALLLAAPGEIAVEELVPRGLAAANGGSGGRLPFPAPLDDITVAAARLMLEECGGNRSEAARRLQVSRRRLRRLLGLGEEGDDEDSAMP